MPGCFVLSLVEIGQAVLEKKILKFVNVVSPFRNYLPFGKDVALDLNKLESPSPKDTLCQVWLKLAQWFWRRRRKCENFTMTTDNGQIVIRKAHLSLWLRWAKKWPLYFFKIMFNIKSLWGDGEGDRDLEIRYCAVPGNYSTLIEFSLLSALLQEFYNQTAINQSWGPLHMNIPFKHLQS